MGRPLVTSSPLAARSGRRAERVPPGRKSWPPCSPAEESTVGTRPGRLPETGLSFQSGPPSEAIVRGRGASQGGDAFTDGSVSMVKGRTCWGSRSSPLPSLPGGLVGSVPCGDATPVIWNGIRSWVVDRCGHAYRRGWI